MQKKIITITVIVAAAAVAVLFFRVDPADSTWMPKCVFKLLTGYDCPGCGSGRALHSLLHGRVGEALRFNPILVLALPYAAMLIWLQYFGGGQHFPRLHHAMTNRTAICIALGIILLYWVVRNIGS